MEFDQTENYYSHGNTTFEIISPSTAIVPTRTSSRNICGKFQLHRIIGLTRVHETNEREVFEPMAFQSKGQWYPRRIFILYLAFISDIVFVFAH